VVDAIHLPSGGAAGELGDGHAGAEADLEHSVTGLHVQQRHRPAVALPVGAAVRHDPAGQASGDASGVTALAHQGADRTPLELGSGTFCCCRHDRQSTASSTLEVKMPEEQLTIGELAQRTGVATSALRYWEECGLLPAPARVSGRRRYPPSTVGLVGEILLLRDVGFTLREVKALIAARSQAGDGWRDLHQRKLTELDQRIARAQAARTAIAYGLACRHEDTRECPNFASVVAARLAGSSLEEAHPH
jgi:DNA-binding transcriptional MerR regulator